MQYSVDQVKHYTTEEDAQNIIYDNRHEAEETLREHSSKRETNENDPNDIWSNPNFLDVFVVNFFQSNDPRAAHEDFRQAEMVEVNDLVSRKIWHKVPLHRDRSNANIVSGSLLLI